MTGTRPQNRRLGYARVSTYGQTLDAQLEQLRGAGCTKIYREKVTGAHNDRRELLKLLKAPKESMMSYFPEMQKGNLDTVKSDAHGKIKKETVALQGVSVTRVTFDVGAKWSNDLKHYAGTQSCQLPHVALVLSGTLRVVMDDGSQQDFSKNDVMLLPPGHDAWSVGDEPCVFVEFSRGNDYYTGEHGH